MAFTEDAELRWARRGLVVLAVAGAVAICWAAWTVTTTSTQSAQAARPDVPESESEPVDSEADQAQAQQEWDEHVAQHEAGNLDHHLTPNPVVEPAPTVAATALPTPVSTATVVPESVPDPTAAPAPTANVGGVNADGRQVGTALPGWQSPDVFPWEPWGPEVTGGSGDVAFSVSVEISDGGSETIGIADSFRGISGIRGGETNSYNVPAGQFIIEQKIESGWPLPDIICSGATPVVTGGVAVFDLNAGSIVDCTFYNVRQADSLSVVETAFDCTGFSGRVLGPQGPFWITYWAEGPTSASGSYSLVDMGTIRVEAPGEFVTPLEFVANTGLDDGDYPIWVEVHDASGSHVPLLDVTTISVGDC